MTRKQHLTAKIVLPSVFFHVTFLSLSSSAFKMAVILGCIDLLLLKLKIHINVVKQSIRLFCGVGGGKVILRIENTTEDP